MKEGRREVIWETKWIINVLAARMLPFWRYLRAHTTFSTGNGHGKMSL